MRAFSTLGGREGFRTEFNFMEVAKPFAMQMTNGNGSEGNSFLNELGRQLKSAVRH